MRRKPVMFESGARILRVISRAGRPCHICSLLLLLPVAVWAQDAKPPELKLKDIRGRQLRLSDYRGKVVLINFWATWCPPCRTEVPDLVKLQRDYRSRGLRVIGVTYPPQTLSEVRRFVRKARMNYPVALGSKETKLLFTASETLPMTIVVGRDGTVLDVIEGILLPEEFEQNIKPLLEADAQPRMRQGTSLLRGRKSTM